MSKLALLGGAPVRTKLFSAYNTIGTEEKAAVMKVLDTGNLSQFLGAWHEDFFGGPTVRAFESAWGSAFHAKHVVSVNSNTSGLIAAIGAVGVSAGDEVIVSPYTMSASAIAPLMYGAVPVFADIDEDTFCITPAAFERAITPRTKALLIVHIFGQSAHMDEIMKIARKHGIKVIEDAAQAPLATYNGKMVGTLGDVGVFSLNYHKHIHTGEGGMVTTNDPEIAERVQLIRNHGENIVGPKGVKNDFNTHGYNFRLPEIEAAIGIEQLKKLPRLLAERIEIANDFSKRLEQFPAIRAPKVHPGNKHVYYVHACRFDANKAGFHRNTFVAALKAEIPSSHLRETTPLVGAGYTRPLYLLPVFQKKLTSCSFACPRYEGEAKYELGLCPTAEKMHFEEVFTHEFIRPSMSKSDVNDVLNAFEKILSHGDELLQWERANKK